MVLDDDALVQLHAVCGCKGTACGGVLGDRTVVRETFGLARSSKTLVTPPDRALGALEVCEQWP